MGEKISFTPFEEPEKRKKYLLEKKFKERKILPQGSVKNDLLKCNKSVWAKKQNH